MKADFNHLASQKQAVLGEMKAIAQKVSKLAAAPGSQKGFSGIKSDSRVSTSSQDGMMGGLLLETLFGGPLMSAMTYATGLPEAASHMDISTTVDAVDEFRTDRMNAPKRNAAPAYDLEEEACVNDMPERSALESRYANLSHILDEIENLEANSKMSRRDYRPTPAMQARLQARPDDAPRYATPVR